MNTQMSPDRSEQEKVLFQSVQDYYSTEESLTYYSDRTRNVGLFDRERAMVKRFMTPPATVLDVGCGAGREAVELTRMGFRVVGVDITPRMLEEARRIASERSLDIEFVQGDGTSLDFPNESFDYLLLITQMIHHVPLKANRQRLLREAGRAAKVGGIVLLTYHDWDLQKNQRTSGWHNGQHVNAPRPGELPKTLKAIEPGDHFTRDCQGMLTDTFGFAHHFTREEMEEEVLAAGLQIVEREGFETIEGGEPDLFWKPTQILVLKTARVNRGNA